MRSYEELLDDCHESLNTIRHLLSPGTARRGSDVGDAWLIAVHDLRPLEDALEELRRRGPFQEPFVTEAEAEESAPEDSAAAN